MEEFLWKVMGILPPVVCPNFHDCFSRKHKNDPRTQSKYWVQLFHCNKENIIQTLGNNGRVVASWLVRSTLDLVVWVWALARDIVSCSWTRHFTFVPGKVLQVYLNLVQPNMITKCPVGKLQPFDAILLKVPQLSQPKQNFLSLFP